MTGGKGVSVPGMGLPLFLRMMLMTIWMMPTNTMKMMGVSSWQRLVAQDRHCRVRSFRNWGEGRGKGGRERRGRGEGEGGRERRGRGWENF